MRRVAWSGCVYRGPSAVDGAEIVGHLTVGSNNTKTGDVATLWIMRADQSPIDAQRSGADVSVCGSCPMRPVTGATGKHRCYVKTYRMRAMWKRAIGLQPDISAACAALREHQPSALRLGGYGDPGCAPERIIRALCSCGVPWLGYTHMWREQPWLAPYAMASVHGEHEAWQAWVAGFRTFRAATRATPLPRLESPCPAYSHGRMCAQCMLCTGADKRRSVTIELHN